MIRTNGKRRGFTLIELMVVIGMILIISGAVTSSMGAARKRVQQERAESEVMTLMQAILAYENYDSNHELKTMKRKEATAENLGFLLGKEATASGKIPALIQASLSASGLIDPWGRPYVVTIQEGTVTTPSFGVLNTGYYLSNFYRLTESERK